MRLGSPTMGVPQSQPTVEGLEDSLGAIGQWSTLEA